MQRASMASFIFGTTHLDRRPPNEGEGGRNFKRREQRAEGLHATLVEQQLSLGRLSVANSATITS